MDKENKPSKKPENLRSEGFRMKRAKTIRMGTTGHPSSIAPEKIAKKSAVSSINRNVKTSPPPVSGPHKDSTQPGVNRKPGKIPLRKETGTPTLQPINAGDNAKPAKKNEKSHMPAGPLPDPPPPVDQEEQKEITKEYKEGKWADSAESRVRNRRTMGRFEFLVEMAHGGMATLYLARIKGPEKFEKLLAIKKIHDHLASQTKFVEMFLDEARIAALIHHPNVATIFDMGKVENSYFIAMEYVHGESLNELIKTCLRQKHDLPWSYAAWIVNQATNGLDAAHKLVSPDGKSLEVVHRDVSPHNILISYEGHVKVVDFGIAYAKERLTHTAHDVLKGKVAYMSPEQTEGLEPDCRSDIFSLGIVLFESVCMQRLFKEKTQAATIRRIAEGRIPKPRKLRSSIPAELERIILKALAKDPAQRYKTAGDLSDDLENLLAAHGESVNPRKTAQLMDRMFHDRIRIKDRQIKAAIENASGAALKDIVGSRETSLSEPSLNKAHTASLSTKKKIALAAAVGIPILILLFLLFFKMADSHQTSGEKPALTTTREQYNSDDDRKNDRSESVLADSKEETEQKPAKTASIQISVSPLDSFAVFSFRGNRYEGSPLNVTVPVSSKPETIIVEAEGYVTQPIVVVPVVDTKIPVTLQKVEHTEMKPDETTEKKNRTKRRRRRKVRQKKKESKSTLLRGIED